MKSNSKPVGKHRRQTTPSPTSRAVAAVVVLAFAAVVIALWWPARQVKLDRDSYDLTIALYSVCNLRSEDRLTEIELLLEQGFESQSDDTEAIRAIRAIVAEARSGDWIDATQACHHLLDQQTVR